MAKTAEKSLTDAQIQTLTIKRLIFHVIDVEAEGAEKQEIVPTRLRDAVMSPEVYKEEVGDKPSGEAKAPEQKPAAKKPAAAKAPKLSIVTPDAMD